MAVRFADRMGKVEGSAIRELLKLTARPEVISFAGGMPAPELFPVEEMKKVSVAVLEEQGKVALQYTTTEGYLPLREKIAQRMNKTLNTNVKPDDILITSGSQQGLDFSGKTFLDKGDVVLCESPSYMGALNAMKAYEPEFIEIATDNDGMKMEELEKVLATTDRVKMIYVIPDFQNPSGRTWPMERRLKFMEIINKYEIPVIEDNPYGELRYEGEFLPSLKSFDKEGYVVYLGTFSKILCPGYRLGWTCAYQNILKKFIFVKQVADLQASSISQIEVSKFIDLYNLDNHVKKINEVYARRRDLMLDCMEKEFPEGVSFTHPHGGLFTWVKLPEKLNAQDLMKKCLENKVAYVPGGFFFPEGNKENYFRLNYSSSKEEKIVEGIKRLGDVLKEALNETAEV